LSRNGVGGRKGEKKRDRKKRRKRKGALQSVVGFGVGCLPRFGWPAERGEKRGEEKRTYFDLFCEHLVSRTMPTGASWERKKKKGDLGKRGGGVELGRASIDRLSIAPRKGGGGGGKKKDTGKGMIGAPSLTPSTRVREGRKGGGGQGGDLFFFAFLNYADGQEERRGGAGRGPNCA